MPKASLSTYAVLGVLSCLVSATPAYAENRSAEAILKILDELNVPGYDKEKMKDEAYALEWRSKRYKVWQKRQELILKLYKADPEHPRIPTLMNERWFTMQARVDAQFNLVPLKDYEYLYKDIDNILAHTKNPELRLKGVSKKALYRLKETHSADLSGVHEYFKLAPQDSQDSHGSGLLSTAVHYAGDEAAQAALKERILKEFPNSRYAEQIRAIRRREGSIGKPVDLEFIDALTGSEVSIKALKGKVVVLDFWATWCGPCVKEIPKMKKLYEEYRRQGVEFIGVSLDGPEEEGGFDKLKAFVRKYEVPWPQYYQGGGWESQFSMSWGINAIPAVFVVDQQGTLYSCDARGKLGEMIPKLLKDRASATPPFP